MSESKRNYFPSPYPLKESIGWLKRYIFGPTKTNKGNVEYISKSHLLNNITPKFTISYIGDIMDMNSKDLIIDETVKNFVKGSDFLIGNFEGIIISERKSFIYKQHKPQIMDTLESLFHPKKTYLSTANNHGGDLGLQYFSDSVNQLKKRGFNVFGTSDHPFMDLTDDLRVIGGTQWSNHPCDYVAKLEESEQYLKQNSFNILFPHWGYEMELYPRKGTISKGEEFLSKFDALIGHHSHCPQPVSSIPIDNVNKLIAYSLGDFCFGSDNKKLEMYTYGIAIKAEIGINPQGKWLIGNVDWTFLKTRSLSKKESTVETVNNFEKNKYSLEEIYV